MIPPWQRTLAFLLVLTISLMEIFPVSADQIVPTKTTIFFEQDGKPVTDPVSFTVDCYGYSCTTFSCEMIPWHNESGGQIPDLVFTYSATCPSFGCSIYEPFYLNYRNISRCTLRGSTGGMRFSLPNYSATPLPDCRYDEQSDFWINGTMYRYPSPYRECRMKNERDRWQCSDYKQEVTFAQLLNMTGPWGYLDNGNYWVFSPDYYSCMERIDTQITNCGQDQPLIAVAPSDFITDPTGMRISRFCTMNVTLPDSQAFAAVTTEMPGQSRNSLYFSGTRGVDISQQDNLVYFTSCTMLRILGGRC
ncbi:MAG: hypothetical protein GYA23_05660 [Methanomicrobiales archaeon]|nr:hypothetical protein [Methanomicrobiales archaeon]